MKYIAVILSVLISHQVLLTAAACSCESSDVSCLETCADKVAKCIVACHTQADDECSNNCITDYVSSYDARYPHHHVVVKRATPAEDDKGVNLAGAEVVSPSSHHSDHRGENKENRFEKGGPDDMIGNLKSDFPPQNLPGGSNHGSIDNGHLPFEKHGSFNEGNKESKGSEKDFRGNEKDFRNGERSMANSVSASSAMATITVFSLALTGAALIAF